MDFLRGMRRISSIHLATYWHSRIHRLPRSKYLPKHPENIYLPHLHILDPLPVPPRRSFLRPTPHYAPPQHARYLLSRPPRHRSLYFSQSVQHGAQNDDVLGQSGHDGRAVVRDGGAGGLGIFEGCGGGGGWCEGFVGRLLRIGQ